ncbi:MAG: hypothetical protein COW42_13565 [Deltaproteobacteria bacterium CG17_big_fil_post_rev_8_21_14_2_50_63_7]|nr:MAG: hypothetical protein COW42_13565 [Deltaproteobacteria bacterium CG17_big_fil_post_rev_8_21_14_2_50_63_7]
MSARTSSTAHSRIGDSEKMRRYPVHKMNRSNTVFVTTRSVVMVRGLGCQNVLTAMAAVSSNHFVGVTAPESSNAPIAETNAPASANLWSVTSLTPRSSEGRRSRSRWRSL